MDYLWVIQTTIYLTDFEVNIFVNNKSQKNLRNVLCRIELKPFLTKGEHVEGQRLAQWLIAFWKFFPDYSNGFHVEPKMFSDVARNN